MKHCPNCGYSTENNENFCQYCGNPLIDDIKKEPKKEDDNFSNYYADKISPTYNICQKCGTKYNANLNGCPNCEKGYYPYKYSNVDPLSKGAVILGVFALITSFFGLMGLVLGIIGRKLYQKNLQANKLYIAAIVIGSLVLALQIALFATGMVREIVFY